MRFITYASDVDQELLQAVGHAVTWLDYPARRLMPGISAAGVGQT